MPAQDENLHPKNPLPPVGRGSVRYVFIDESGDLGLKGSKYLVLAALMIEEPKHLNRLIKRIRRKHKSLNGTSELKANKSSDEIRAELLRKVNGLPSASAFFIVLEKKKLFSEYLRENKHRLYNYVAGKLAGYLPLEGLNVRVIIDRSKGRQMLEQDFNDYFMSRIRQKGSPDRITIQHSYSQNWAGLQVVDFLAWAAFQKFERNDSSFIELLKIQNEVYYVW